MAVYSSEFQGANAFEPVDPPVFLGLEPLLLALLVAFLAAAALMGWWLGSRRTSPDTDAAEDIWKTIDEALKAAMKADGGALAGKAEEAERVIQRKLGATLALGGGFAEGRTALKHALAGRRPGAHDPEHDDPEETSEPHGGDETGEGANRSGSITQVNVFNGLREEGGKSAGNRTGSGHGGGGHGTHLTPRERDHAIRAAIADLNDYWRLKSDRIGDMRAAHRELSSD